MIIHDYDPGTESVVDVRAFYGERKHLVDRCMVIFSRKIYDELLKHFSCVQIGTITACNGESPIWQTEYKGVPFAFYLTGIGSAMASCMCYEAHWMTGAERFVMFGSCGSLNREMTAGRYVVPTEAYRGEGASYYYAEPADYITVRQSDRTAEIMKEIGVPCVQGRVWTTDSMLRETKNLVQRRKSEGCIAVEMELAGVEAVCDFYGLSLYSFLQPGDVLEENSYEADGLSWANHDLAKLSVALELIRRI